MTLTIKEIKKAYERAKKAHGETDVPTFQQFCCGQMAVYQTILGAVDSGNDDAELWAIGKSTIEFLRSADKWAEDTEQARHSMPSGDVPGGASDQDFSDLYLPGAAPAQDRAMDGAERV